MDSRSITFESVQDLIKKADDIINKNQKKNNQLKLENPSKNIKMLPAEAASILDQKARELLTKTIGSNELEVEYTGKLAVEYNKKYAETNPRGQVLKKKTGDTCKKLLASFARQNLLNTNANLLAEELREVAKKIKSMQEWPVEIEQKTQIERVSKNKLIVEKLQKEEEEKNILYFIENKQQRKNSSSSSEGDSFCGLSFLSIYEPPKNNEQTEPDKHLDNLIDSLNRNKI